MSGTRRVAPPGGSEPPDQGPWPRPGNGASLSELRAWHDDRKRRGLADRERKDAAIAAYAQTSPPNPLDAYRVVFVGGQWVAPEDADPAELEQSQRATPARTERDPDAPLDLPELPPVAAPPPVSEEIEARERQRKIEADAKLINDLWTGAGSHKAPPSNGVGTHWQKWS